MKRKREQAADEDDQKQIQLLKRTLKESKEEEGEELCFDRLPGEIVDTILRFAIARGSSALYPCRLTCRLWYDLLPKPDKKKKKKKKRKEKKNEEDEEKEEEDKGIEFALRVAKEGNLKLLQWGVANGAPFVHSKVSARAASWGHLDMLKWLRDNGCRFNFYACCGMAASNGKIEALDWLLKESVKGIDPPMESHFARHVLNKAAKGGHQEVLEWLRGQGYEIDNQTFLGAVKGGNVSLVKWLVELNSQCFPSNLKEIAQCAASGGSIEMLDYVKDKCDWPLVTPVLAAVKKLHLKVLKWLKDNASCDWSTAFGHAACTRKKLRNPKKRLKVLDWLLREIGCPLDFKRQWEKAIRRGDLELLRFLETRKEEKDVIDPISSIREASTFGQLEVLKWLKEEKGIQIEDSKAAAKAAKNDHFKTLKWLASQPNFRLDERTFARAARGGSLKMLKWLLEMGCPRDTTVYSMATFEGRKDVLEWLKANDFPWNELEIREAAYGRADPALAAWLLSNGLLKKFIL